MTKEVRGIRPTVISTETGTRPDEYRRFRHVVRNVYTHRFDRVSVSFLKAEQGARILLCQLGNDAKGDWEQEWKNGVASLVWKGEVGPELVLVRAASHKLGEERGGVQYFFVRLALMFLVKFPMLLTFLLAQGDSDLLPACLPTLGTPEIA